jgi:dihydroorotate dehydrogenase (fumarate)
VAEQIKKQITIPFSLKIGYYFSSVVHTITKLSESGASGLVLFNRPYHPDIDIRELEISTGQVYTTFDDYLHTLRWVAILSGKVKCDICASTGIHSYDVIIKQILAGASAIQIASALYKQGSDVIPGMLKGIKTWMEIHDFKSIDQFKGMFSQKNIDNPAAFERVQFMKLYSRIE